VRVTDRGRLFGIRRRPRAAPRVRAARSAGRYTMGEECDMRSHRRVRQKKGCPQASVQKPVPSPTAKLVTARSGARVKAQGRPTIGTSTGQGKTGRANVSESLMRLRNHKSSERWLIKTMTWAIDMSFLTRSCEMSDSPQSDMRTPRPRSIEDAHPSRISKMRNVTTPMGVWSRGRGDTLQASKPTATTANPPAGQDDPRSESGQPKGNGNS
jgi:hypothetical protein